jgi:CDP-diacylglycerol--serine O-phosphatidyltransferase
MMRRAFHRRRMRRLLAIPVLPTLFTLGNLVCGFFAIVVAARVDRPVSIEVPTAVEIAFKDPARIVRQLDVDDPTHNCMLSGLLIFLAMVFDACDGYVARLARQASEFGGQLDSLSDVVSFGVAPGFLLVKMCPSFTYQHRDLVWVIAATFAVCAALRLARFNAESGEEDDHLTFQGLPSPGAAASIAGFAMLFYTLRKETNAFAYAEPVDMAVQTLLPFYALLVALLMVSRIPYPHVINQALRGRASFAYIVGLVFAVVAVMVIRGFSLPLVGLVFVLSGPAQLAWKLAWQRKTQEEPLF